MSLALSGGLIERVKLGSTEIALYSVLAMGAMVFLLILVKSF